MRLRVVPPGAGTGDGDAGDGNTATGMATVAKCVSVDQADPEALFQLAEHEDSDLTVIGPELPLAKGVADRFAAGGRLLFGPTRAAARLESSKAFAKAFMVRHRIPTAAHEIHTDISSALAAVRSGRFGYPVVIKADGLAAGKGVIIATDLTTAEQAVQEILVEQRFGTAGATVVIEEHLKGEEASFFAICDGQTAFTLPSAQDHKRVFNGDEGPNTGGMGAFAPTPQMTDQIQARVISEIVEPVLAGMVAEGQPYVGVLYIGLMLTVDGPKVIEFNVRFGDPECQVLMMLLKSELYPLLKSVADGNLGEQPNPEFHDGSAVTVVMCSEGYPEKYEKGHGIDWENQTHFETPNMKVFHAGTKWEGDRYVTDGGRVLNVTSKGSSLKDARERAYETVKRISWEGSFYRSDIGAE